MAGEIPKFSNLTVKYASRLCLRREVREDTGCSMGEDRNIGKRTQRNTGEKQNDWQKRRGNIVIHSCVVIAFLFFFFKLAPVCVDH